MNTTTQLAQPGLRRAALALHALDEDDRSWTLAGLDQPVRMNLQALLQELKALGIPRDEQLLREALASAQSPLVTPAAAPLETLSTASLWAGIQHEPAAVQAACLSLLAPEARGKVLRLAPAKVQSEQAAGRHAAPASLAPALKAAIENIWLEAASLLARDTALEATP